MTMFAIRCETTEKRAPVRTVTVLAESSEEANNIFRSSNTAPYPQMRSKGYVPISIFPIQG